MEECTEIRNRKQRFFSPDSVKKKSGAHQAYHPKSTAKSYSGIKRSGREANQTPPFCDDRKPSVL
jgi:hypothetical protein